jgi:hypothetical protein
MRLFRIYFCTSRAIKRGSPAVSVGCRRRPQAARCVPRGQRLVDHLPQLTHRGRARHRAAIITVQPTRHARGLSHDRERVSPSTSKVGEPRMPHRAASPSSRITWRDTVTPARPSRTAASRSSRTGAFGQSGVVRTVRCIQPILPGYQGRCRYLARYSVTRSLDIRDCLGGHSPRGGGQHRQGRQGCAGHADRMGVTNR